jgi:hypothetical protein
MPVASSRAARLAVALVCALGLTLAISAAPAGAVKIGHAYDFSFGNGLGEGAGQFGENPYMGIGVDEDTGAIYVADGFNSRIQKFDSAGNFLLTWGYGVNNGANEMQVCVAPGPCQEGLFGPAPGQLENPTDVVVDNSGGPNDGNVYVVDQTASGYQSGQGFILKYSPTGTYLGKIDGSGSPSGKFQAISPDNGVSIDAEGTVWVADAYTDKNYESRIMRFSDQPANDYIGGSQFAVKVLDDDNVLNPAPAFQIAATANGQFVYGIAFYQGNCCSLYRFNANGAGATVVPPVNGGAVGGGPLMIEHSTGHIYYGDVEHDANFVPFAPPFLGKSCCSDFAYRSVTGMVYAPELFAGKVNVFKPRRVAEATTEAATDVLHTTATIHGHTAPDTEEGGDVTGCKFEWGITTTYENETPCEPGAPFTGPASVKLDLSALATESVYHYRLVTTNSVDTNYGKDLTFQPRSVFGINTDPATELSSHTAMLNGSFNPSGEQTDYQFEWGVNKDNLDHITGVEDGGATSGVKSVSEEIEGLEDYTTYFFRIVATNSFGTSVGGLQKFRTEAPDLPDIAGTAVSSVGNRSAHLSATVTPNFGETFYGFEYGETLAYDGQVLGETLLPANDQAQAVEADIEGLTPGRTYHYRAIAINFGGISYGPDLTFTTLDVPAIVSSEVSSVTESGAQLKALVSASLSPTSVWFEYGTSTDYGTTTSSSPIGAGLAAVPVATGIAGLAPNTTYHFRVVAGNEVGTARGSDQTFTTPPGAIRRETPKPPRCKRGFVKRKGKCVKKKTKKKQQSKKAKGARA